MSGTIDNISSHYSSEGILTHLVKGENVDLKLMKSPEGDLCRHGMLSLRIAGELKHICISTEDPEVTGAWDNRVCRFVEFVDLVSNFSDEPRTLLFNYLVKHIPAQANPKVNFSNIVAKVRNLSVVHINSEKNIKIEFKTIAEEQINAIREQKVPQGKAISPIQLIKNIVSNEEVWRTLAMNHLCYRGVKKYKPIVKEEMITSCAYTSGLVATLFFGVEKYIQILGLLEEHIRLTQDYMLPSGKSMEIVYDGIFNGLVLNDLRQEDPNFLNQEYDVANEMMIDKYEKYMKKFTAHLTNIVWGRYQTIGFRTLDKWKKDVDNTIAEVVKAYPFNNDSLENLKQEVFKNVESVTHDRSYCYYIVLKMIGGFTKHVFVVEQYLTEEDENVSYRLYQSWIGQFSLKEHLEKKKDGDEDFAEMNEYEFYIFLRNLNAFFDEGSSRNGTKLATAFGALWEGRADPVNFKGNVIGACDLVYWCEPVNPADFWDHFVALASPNSSESVSYEQRVDMAAVAVSQGGADAVDEDEARDATQ